MEMINILQRVDINFEFLALSAFNFACISIVDPVVQSLLARDLEWCWEPEIKWLSFELQFLKQFVTTNYIGYETF